MSGLRSSCGRVWPFDWRLRLIVLIHSLPLLLLHLLLDKIYLDTLFKNSHSASDVWTSGTLVVSYLTLLLLLVLDLPLQRVTNCFIEKCICGPTRFSNLQ